MTGSPATAAPTIGKSSVVLLGAGASVEAGVPATFDMTEQLVGRVARQRYTNVAQALHFVCGALVAYDTAAGASPYEGLDVERVFAAVELLAERRTLEVTPFVSAWHPAVDAWDRPTQPAFIDRDLQRAVLGEPGRSAAQVIGTLIASKTGTGTGETYRYLAQRMIDELRSLVAVDSGSVGYLEPMVRAGSQRGGLTIATLNYDIAIEEACRRAGVDVQTHIDRWATDGKWDWPAEGVRLLKLHGSIDWCWDDSMQPRGHLRHRTVEAVPPSSDDHRSPAVVFGNRGKLRADGPFLSLLAEFETLLAVADQLVVVGYSFRDDHVNEIVRRWAAEDLGRTVLIIDPAFPDAPERNFRTELLSALNPSKWEQNPWEPRVAVVRSPASQALPHLFS